VLDKSKNNEDICDKKYATFVRRSGKDNIKNVEKTRRDLLGERQYCR